MKYVAFLRGINVGGNMKVSMSELKKALTDAGFKDVKTLLNSGNVVFEAEGNGDHMSEKIASIIKKAFGLTIHVIVRTQREIEALVVSEPFKHIKITPQIRLYATFMTKKSSSSLQIPYESEDTSFRILEITKNTIISALDISKRKGTTDVMKILEKEFGKQITTRNWNTVVKTASL